MGNQQLAVEGIEVTERDSRMSLNEHQLAETQQRHSAAPVPINPSFEVLDSPNVFEDLNGIPSTTVQEPSPAANTLLSPNSPQCTSDTLQEVAAPTVVEATGWVTPMVSVSNPFSVAAQNAVSSMPQSFHPSGVSPAPVAVTPQLAELVPASSLPTATNVVVPSATAANGSNPTELFLVQQLQAEVVRLTNALQLQQQQLQQMQQQHASNPQLAELAPIANLPTATNAVVPCAHAGSGSHPTMAKASQAIASPYAPPAIAKGAALGAPLGIKLSQASLAGTPCGNSRCRATGSESFRHSRGRCFLRVCPHCPLFNKVYNFQGHNPITVKVHLGLLTLPNQGHHPTIPPNRL